MRATNGPLIKRLRREKGHSQLAASKAAGIAKGSWAKAERGGQLQDDVLGKIATFLGTKIVDLTLTDIGFRAFSQLCFARSVNEILTELMKNSRYDRIRLYVLNGASLDGFAELGGVLANFRRVRVPVCTDVLSQVLVQFPGAIRYSRKSDSDTAIVKVESAHVLGKPKDLPNLGMLTAHDQPLLQRAEVFRWMDSALVPTRRKKLVGKLSIDCLWSDRYSNSATSISSIDKLKTKDTFLSAASQRLADTIRLFQQGQLNLPVAEPTTEAKRQAHRYLVVEDQLLTLLASCRSDPDVSQCFDRVRLYLTAREHNRLFSSFVEEAGWGFTGNFDGFAGLVELGGVNEPFSNVRLTSTGDPCTRIYFGTDLVGEEQDCHDDLAAGEPVVFTTEVTRTPADAKPRFCFVEGLSEAQLSREDVLQHLDVPILSHGNRMGKLSLDAKWRHGGRVPAACGPAAQAARKYAQLAGEIIAVADQVPNDSLAAAVDGILPQTGHGIFL